MVEAKELFNRVDLHQLNYFLVHGKEDNDKKTLDYEARIKNVSINVIEKMQALKLEHNTYEEITGDIFQVFHTYEEVFTEIGMKAGARICFQLFCEDEKNFKK